MPGEDRISQLPEHLRHYILSHLSLEDAIKTTLLSRSWREAWLGLLSLDLDQKLFNKITQNKPFNHVTEDRYLDIIHQVLTRRRKSDKYITLQLQRLNIFVPNEARNRTSQLNQWLDWAVNEFHVKELSFSFEKELRGHYMYDLPVSILASRQSEITQLNLRNCLLDSPVKTQWSTLKGLSLTKVKLNQEILDSITAKANCPHIEGLYFDKCHGLFDTLNVSSLKRLVSILIFMDMNLKRADIDAPNLQFFLYSANYTAPFQTVSGSGFQVNDLGTVSKGLKDLIFTNNAGLSDDWLNRNLAHFSNLGSLSLCRCHNVKHLKISSTTLTTLLVNGCKGLGKAEIETPRLKFLSYSHWGLDIPSLELSALSLEKAVVSLLTLYQRDDHWHEKFIRFLSNFKDCQEFVLEDTFAVYKYMMISPNLRKSFSPPLYGVKHVTIKIDARIRFDFNLAELVDALLWLSPLPETVSLIWTSDDKMVEKMLLKFKYMEKNTTTMECSRCNSLPNQCWRHCLTELTIENKKADDSNPILRDEHAIQLRVFF